ncbi:MAG: VOC family protein [Cyanobacteria bacterium J06626_4]
MKFGLMIYAIALQPMIDFYVNVLGFRVRESDDESAALMADECELVLLQAPTDIANSVHVTCPPQAREATPIKPVFFIHENLAELRARVHQWSGHFNDVTQEWAYHGDTVCDGWDLEGNIFQGRCSETGLMTAHTPDERINAEINRLS